MRIRLAGCVIEDNDGKILLIHRNTPGRIQWELPGGKIEPGESASDAAIREVKEELGVEVLVDKEIGGESFTEDNYLIDYKWFQVKIISGTPNLQEQIFDDLKYFSWEELRDQTDLSANVQNLVKAHYSKLY